MRIRVVLNGVALVSLLFASACTGAGETAVVTQRPQPPVTEPVAETPALPEPVAQGPRTDDVTVGRFDTGKMWTFDNPPLDYFAEAYGFQPDSAWFDRARLGGLRFATYCSASFVSPNGLIMTNHHCARESVVKVTRPGESLLDTGFYAPSIDEERKVDELFVDQLIEIDDVTEQVYARIRNIRDDQRRAEVLETTTEQIEKRLTEEAKGRGDTTLYVQVIELYNGGKYSAYTFKRYWDVRLVMAPELQIAHFGGEYDNFTYPRYSLDMAFFRAYDTDGTPFETEYYFPFSEHGASVNEVVFVVGNPGSTSRLNTVSQLIFEREYMLPQQLDILRARADALQAYIETHEAEADQYDLRNVYFSLTNSIKALSGQLEGLRDESLIARRQAAEDQLQQAILATDTLRAAYGNVITDIEDLQRSREATAAQAGAFFFFGAEDFESHVLLRALYGYIYDFLRQRGAGQDMLQTYREGGLKVTNWPPEVEEAFLAARLREVQRAFGPNDPTVRRVLRGRTPEEVAQEVVANTALIDSAGFAGLLERGYLSSSDPTVPVIEALAPLYLSLSEQQQSLDAREENLNAQLARARFVIYGTDIPPDASFSPRLADGVVKPYPYNGTIAPAWTTMFGLYDREASFSERFDEWELPEKWLTPPATFDRSTPINLVSTNDITGGNSGSPLLNRDLEIVGLIFDGNIESLPSVYLYTDETNRAVSVDSRGILESLDEIYDADRLVLELRQSRFVPTEEEADEILSTL